MQNQVCVPNTQSKHARQQNVPTYGSLLSRECQRPCGSSGKQQHSCIAYMEICSVQALRLLAGRWALIPVFAGWSSIWTGTRHLEGSLAAAITPPSSGDTSSSMRLHEGLQPLHGLPKVQPLGLQGSLDPGR